MTEFVVLERNEQALRSICERLVREIDSTDAVRTHLAAGRKLAAIKDPIAVDYLRRVAEGRRYAAASIAIGGLERLDTPPARAALKAATSHRNLDIANEAKRSLERLERKPRP